MRDVERIDHVYMKARTESGVEKVQNERDTEGWSSHQMASPRGGAVS